MQSKQPVTIADRLRFGSLGVAELARLKGVSAATVRSDIRAGLLPITRHRRRVLVKGSDAARYLGEGTL